MLVAVNKINNPKSENNGMWTVMVENGHMRSLKTVFMSKSKKVCVEYAKKLAEKPIISNGIEYGARF